MKISGRPVPISLVIIDPHQVVRTRVRTSLELEQDIQVVGEAGTAAAGVLLVQRLQPHMVVLDVQLPDGSGAEVCERLLSVAPDLRALVFTRRADDATIVSVIQSGVEGYLLKDASTPELVRAIRTVAGGQGYLDFGLTNQVLRWIRMKSQGDPLTRSAGDIQLTTQQRLIMPLLAEGKTNKEIGATLGLSEKTVKNYLANIFDKLKVRRRTEAVAWYLNALDITLSGSLTWTSTREDDTEERRLSQTT